MKVTPALDCPPDVLTTTGPVVAPDGTFVSISSVAQLVVDAVVPLKVTEPEAAEIGALDGDRCVNGARVGVQPGD